MKQSRLIKFIGTAFLVAGCGTATSPANFSDGGVHLAAEKGKTYHWTFDDTSLGFLPEKFFSVLGSWQVTQDSSAPSSPNVLRQTGKFGGDDFPRILVQDLDFSNFNLRVTCRPEEGSKDQACGVLFRAKDSNNYYIARANALEGNVNFYRVVNSDRQMIYSAQASVATGTWQTLEIVCQGEEIKISWNGSQVISVRDSTFQSGKVGLWTKADSVTAFDELESTELP